MARPIAETPILSGNDALRFEEAINNVRPLVGLRWTRSISRLPAK